MSKEIAITVPASIVDAIERYVGTDWASRLPMDPAGTEQVAAVLRLGETLIGLVVAAKRAGRS